MLKEKKDQKEQKCGFTVDSCFSQRLSLFSCIKSTGVELLLSCKFSLISFYRFLKQLLSCCLVSLNALNLSLLDLFSQKLLSACLLLRTDNKKLMNKTQHHVQEIELTSLIYVKIIMGQNLVKLQLNHKNVNSYKGNL